MPREDTLDDAVEDDSDSDTEDEVEEEEDSRIMVHPYRYRLWGLTSSPADGTTAALVSKYSTQFPSRRGACKLVFGSISLDQKTRGDTPKRDNGKLTTEAKMWEWMYGGGDEVPGVTTHTSNASAGHDSSLQDFFKDIRDKQKCAFCESELQNDGTEARCHSGHSFSKSITPIS